MPAIKQRISMEQLQELTDQQKERLREWWQPHDYDIVWDGKTDFAVECDLGGQMYLANDQDGLCPPFGKDGLLPLLSVGQCVELLQSFDEALSFNRKTGLFPNELNVFGWEVELRLLDKWFTEKELIDALWEAVKAVL